MADVRIVDDLNKMVFVEIWKLSDEVAEFDFTTTKAIDKLMILSDHMSKIEKMVIATLKKLCLPILRPSDSIIEIERYLLDLEQGYNQTLNEMKKISQLMLEVKAQMLTPESLTFLMFWHNQIETKLPHIFLFDYLQLEAFNTFINVPIQLINEQLVEIQNLLPMIITREKYIHNYYNECEESINFLTDRIKFAREHLVMVKRKIAEQEREADEQEKHMNLAQVELLKNKKIAFKLAVLAKAHNYLPLTDLLNLLQLQTENKQAFLQQVESTITDKLMMEINKNDELMREILQLTEQQESKVGAETPWQVKERRLYMNLFSPPVKDEVIKCIVTRSFFMKQSLS